MSKMKNWMMDQDEMIWEAVERGANTQKAVLAYGHTNMSPVDDNYVIRTLLELNGPES